MILLDKPLISDFVKDTIRKQYIQALDTGNMLKSGELNTLAEQDVISAFKADIGKRLHTTSENAISWIENNLGFTNLPGKISLFKNKFKFRELTKDMYPDLFYQEVSLKELDDLNFDLIPFPFIIKPNVGFFSMGVHKVPDRNEWERVKIKIKSEIEHIQAVYPKAVLDTGSFIIEECIEGTEYAVDAYYNDSGEAVVLGVMKHVFGSNEDVSDRVYLTSKNIVRDKMKSFDHLLEQIGKRAGLKNFSLHVEVRIDENNMIVPIEVNPLRFGAWCTSADIMHYAFGFNPYTYYLNNQKPDWDKIFSECGDDIYSIIILDNSTGYSAEHISSFDFDTFLSRFRNPLELRKIDYMQYPLFGILFARTRVDEYREIENMLYSDLREFVEIY